MHRAGLQSFWSADHPPSEGRSVRRLDCEDHHCREGGPPWPSPRRDAHQLGRPQEARTRQEGRETRSGQEVGQAVAGEEGRKEAFHGQAGTGEEGDEASASEEALVVSERHQERHQQPWAEAPDGCEAGTSEEGSEEAGCALTSITPRDGGDRFTLASLRSTYLDATDSASSIIRQLAAAGLGFVWVFSLGSSATVTSKLHIPSSLLWVGLLLAICLGLDLMQSLYKAALFGLISRAVEKDSTGFEGLIRKELNYPTLAFFIGKALALGAAYLVLAWVLADRIS